jgi:uncharacterized membrane protein
MNAAHLHITINHFPVFCVLIGLLVLAIGQVRRSREITMVALILFVLAAVVVIPTYTSGRGSSRVIRGLPGVAREFTRSHSSAAWPALIATLILGALAAWGLVQWRRLGDITSWVRGAVWGLAIASTGLLLWTAYLGGEVRHTEARPDYVIPTAEPTSEATPEGAPGTP